MTKKNTSKTKSTSRICMTKKTTICQRTQTEGDNGRSRHKSKHDNNR